MENEFIGIDSAICHGKPHIRGTRIPVYLILELLEGGNSISDITERIYPELTANQIKAVLRYSSSILKHEEMVLT